MAFPVLGDPAFLDVRLLGIRVALLGGRDEARIHDLAGHRDVSRPYSTLAWAFRWRKMLDTGVHATRKEIWRGPRRGLCRPGSADDSARSPPWAGPRRRAPSGGDHAVWQASSVPEYRTAPDPSARPAGSRSPGAPDIQ